MITYFRLSLVSAAFLLALPIQSILAAANEGPKFVNQYIDSPELVGQGQYRQAFWKIYDARLFANQGKYAPDNDFALQLEYSRSLSGQHIVDKSIELIFAQGPFPDTRLEQWEQILDAVIPDVKKGDQLTGIRLSSTSYFYLNDELVGEISEPQLNQYFFDIWLGEDTSAPDLRQKLLGQNSSDSQ